MLTATFLGTKVPFADSGLHSELEVEYKIEQCPISALSGHLFQDSVTTCCKHAWRVELNFHCVQSSKIRLMA